MPIQVICPGCHQRFSVSEKFAGQQGPCPKCKEVIEIPKPEDEVVIHAPAEASGPTDAKGRLVLKTAKFKDAKFQPILAAGIGVVVLLTLLAAILLRAQQGDVNPVFLVGGTLLLGPLIAWAGYPFLRDQELAPYEGGELWVRSAACGLAYALAWGVYCAIAWQLAGEWPLVDLPFLQIALATGAAIAVGVLAGYVALDLEPLVAGVHFALFFLATVGLRWIMALPPLPGMAFE